ALAGNAQSADYTLRLGHVLAPTDPLSVAADGMKKAIEERSGGKIAVRRKYTFAWLFRAATELRSCEYIEAVLAVVLFQVITGTR
ncbi:MAG: hypothetical protein WD229_17315, partial [Pirellulales bacterium]